ncbi:MAG: SH3 beta-barrel fold-containing protein [Candidatus Limimorpha sp.]
MYKTMLIEEAKRQMRNGVFHFEYMKKNGECRETFGTLNKGVINATLTGTGESPETWGCCYYHDTIKGGARSSRGDAVFS